MASLCAENVVNTNVPCCGMAGDRGMRYPELTGASLQVGGLVAGRWVGWVGLAGRVLVLLEAKSTLPSFKSRP